MNYQSVALGGTFDRLHKGHQALLRTAFEQGVSVIIGLTTDAFVHATKRNKSAGKSTAIRPYEQRKRELVKWLHTQGWEGRYTVVPLSDSFGPTVPGKTDQADNRLEAIIVSEETAQTAHVINDQRQKFGWKPLQIVVVPMVPAKDDKPISSTRIRNHEITKEGDLILPYQLRVLLRQSIGSIIPEPELASRLSADAVGILITIGDMTTRRVMDLNIRPSLAAIDFQMERNAYEWDKTVFDRLTDGAIIREIDSGPGYISKAAIDAFHEWADGLRKSGTKTANRSLTVLIINGEEDLLVLPALMEAPLGSVIVYGQPGRGMVRIEVTATQKRYAQTLLGKFIPHGHRTGRRIR